MKLKPEQKFILPDDNGDLILITEVDFDYLMLQNRIISMKGIRFDVDYVDDEIVKRNYVDVQVTFSIDGIYGDME